MEVGQSSEVRRSYSGADLQGFAMLSGTGVPATIPEPLIAAMFSYLLGVKLPGRGTNYLKQELNFLAKAMPDTELTARVEITRLRADKHLVDLWATCIDADGVLICEGRSLVKAKDVAS
ncbi:phosphate acetyltransferase [Hoeflea sp. AS60]|uniref:phosphate acetyltransferase n=1 Tax=Hoeflea sp. AS60 TaxID=3135780 RepID=UPI003171D1B2